MEKKNKKEKEKGEATSSLSWWSCMAVACMVGTLVMAKHAEGGLSCGDAVNALIPCGAYLIGDGPENPSAQCCASAQGLKKMAKTVESRRELCQCFKDTGPSFGVKPDRAKHLPSSCKLHLTIPINPSLNCSTIA